MKEKLKKISESVTLLRLKLRYRLDFTPQSKTMWGFTLIELLIVIALIGVLAVAFLAAVNPLEQAKKGRDSARRKDSLEILNAIERYYGSFFCYPWDTASGACNSTITTILDPADNPNFLAGPPEGNLYQVTVVAEVKDEFANRIMNNTSDPSFQRLWMREVGGIAGSYVGDVHVCFEPESNFGRLGGMGTRVDDIGSSTEVTNECDVAYAGGGSGGSCWVCLPE